MGLISFKRITVCQKFSDVKHRNCHHASLSLWLALKHLASFWSFECKFDLRGKKASIEMHAIGGPVHRRRLHGLEALSWMENTFPGASVFHPPDPLDKVFHHFVSYTTTTTNVYILPKDFILSIWEIWFVWYPMVWLAGCLEALTMSELASCYSADDPVIWLFDDLVIIHDSWWIMKQIIHDSLVMIVDGSKLASWYSSGHRGASQLFSTVQTFSESLGRVANAIFTESVCNGGHEGNTPPRPCLVKT